MANPNNQTPGNAPGAFYVDTNCTGCGLCEADAPDHFQVTEADIAVVVRQPDTDAERQACEQARENCPVDAIGNDG